MHIKKINDDFPEIDKKSFIIGESYLSGSLKIGEYSSIWPGVSARADVDKITIGKYTNIQDNSVLHCDHGSPLIIGDYVTVGHNSVVHGCAIGDRVLIGISAVILSGSVIENDVLVGAGSLVTERKVLKSGKLYMGAPAKAVRDLTCEEKEKIRQSALHYVEIARNHDK